jgi:hypothetical protein
MTSSHRPFPRALPRSGRRACATVVVSLLSVASVADVVAAELAQTLRRLAPELEPRVIDLALNAKRCAREQGAIGEARRLAVIDYSLPSTEARMWVFDLDAEQLLHREHVAHGRGSGENLPDRFSNEHGSHQTSLGLFRTGETYHGGNGYSLRMDGLEAGINDQARDRLIVMHGAPYVNPQQALRQGRLGRSFGCPAVRPEVARPMIDSLKDGQLLFAYYPDRSWLENSTLVNCGTTVTASAGSSSAAGSP